MGVELLSGPRQATYVPDADALAQCRQLGGQIGRKLIERFEVARAFSP